MISAFLIDFAFVLLAMTLLSFWKPQIARQTSRGKAVALLAAMSMIVFVMGVEIIKAQGNTQLSELESFTVTISAVILGYVIGIANSRALRERGLAVVSSENTAQASEAPDEVAQPLNTAPTQAQNDAK